MKRVLIASLLGLAAFGLSPVASAHVSVDIGIALPGFIAAPPVVYAPPPQPYYAPPPVVVYGGGYYGRPGWQHDHHDHRYHDNRYHDNRGSNGNWHHH